MKLQLLRRVTGWTGRNTISAALYIVDVTVFIIQALQDAISKRSSFNRGSYRALVTQLIFTGIDALPLITLLALTTGTIFTSQLIHLTSDFTEEAEIINTIVILTTYEIAPLLTAFILIGRTSSAMTVDLGNMKLHGEVESLELVGININDFLISTRLVAAAIAQLVLATYFAGLALYGGVTLAGLAYSTTYLLYINQILQAHTALILILFVCKNLLFGLIISGTACLHALQVDRSATEVPQQTQKAIVNALAIIAIFDGLLALAAQ